MWKKSLRSGLLFLLWKIVTDVIYERKKGVKTNLKERTEIFLLLSIHDNGVRHDMKCLHITLRRTNVRVARRKRLLENELFISFTQDSFRSQEVFLYSRFRIRKVSFFTGLVWYDCFWYKNSL